MVSGLIQSGTDIQVINITWNIPTVPNGIIIIYEIRYRESNSNGPYNMANTTNTQFSIGGLLPNTNYTIGVRAYTSVGPGEWNDTQISTSNIRKSLVCLCNCLFVLAMWQPITAPEVKHYTVYYISTSKHKRQSDIGNKIFPAGSSEGVIEGLQDNLDYLFSLSVTYEINGVEYERESKLSHLIKFYLPVVNYIKHMTQVNLGIRAGSILVASLISLSSLPS